MLLGYEDEVGERAGEEEHAVERQRDQEQVEVAVVAFTYTVADPWTMVVEPLHTVIADGTVGRSWWSEYFAGKAVFQLHGLTLDLYLLSPWWWPVGLSRTRLFNFSLYTLGLC